MGFGSGSSGWEVRLGRGMGNFGIGSRGVGAAQEELLQKVEL
jgi:hypothetical protein